MPTTNLEIILFEPEIPQNTGNIGRLCVGFNARLTLLGPLGFKITEKAVRRSGLDYWPHLDWQHILESEDYLKKKINEGWQICTLSTKSETKYTNHSFQNKTALVFGPETRGLPESWISKDDCHHLTIPMPGKVRSYNLANSVAMVLAETYRQLNL